MCVRCEVVIATVCGGEEIAENDIIQQNTQSSAIAGREKIAENNIIQQNTQSTVAMDSAKVVIGENTE